MTNNGKCYAENVFESWMRGEGSFLTYGRGSGKAFLRAEHLDGDWRPRRRQACEDWGKSNLTRRNRVSEAWGGKKFGILEELPGGQCGGERVHIDQAPQVVDDRKDELIWIGKKDGLQSPWPVNANRNPYLPLMQKPVGKYQLWQWFPDFLPFWFLEQGEVLVKIMSERHPLSMEACELM